MFKETLGAAVLGVTLASVPGAATASAQDPGVTSTASSATAATAATARREALTVRIDTERLRRWRGHIEIQVREADSRERVRGVRACLQTRRWGGRWHHLGCEFTDWRGEADWYVRADRHRSYRIHIRGTWRYYPYRSDWFHIRDRWHHGGDWNRDNGRDHDNGRDLTGDRRR